MKTRLLKKLRKEAKNHVVVIADGESYCVIKIYGNGLEPYCYHTRKTLFDAINLCEEYRRKYILERVWEFRGGYPKNSKIKY